MSSIKRTRQINLTSMRKSFALKPLAVGMAGLFISACAEKEDATIFTSVDECKLANPNAAAQCEAAYQNAVQEAARTSPRFDTVQDCEYEFGTDRCQVVENNGNSFFMPFMAGYMVSNLLSPRYYSQPLYTSSSRYSPFRSRWVTADGRIFDGDIRKRNYRVSPSVYKPKPTVNKTINRGGFGSSVRAKSSWGSSSRSGGWGG